MTISAPKRPTHRPDSAPLDCLVVGAHPDDAELFAGGFIALCARQGLRVGIAHLTRGERSTRGSPAERREEALQAAGILGVCAADVAFLDLGDTRLDNNEPNRLEIIALLRRRRPRLVLYHHPADRHPDHRKAGVLTEDACFYSRLERLETPGLEPFSPPARLMFLNNSAPPTPSALVLDITSVFERKIQAVRAYRSQFYNPRYRARPTHISSREFFEQIEVRARYFGGLVGVRYGEPYQTVGPLGVCDPQAVFPFGLSGAKPPST